MKLKAGVVGVGYLGRFHAQKIHAHPEVELIGVCDFLFSQAEKVAAELNVKAFSQPTDLIGKVDYVHIAASTSSHYELAKLFLNAKIPVLVEKPIAATITQAEELCEIADKNNTLLTVGHIERFNPAFLLLKNKAAEVKYLEINRLAPFRTRGSDVSVLHDLTIHDLDLVQWIFESDIESFEAFGKKIIQPTFDEVSIRLKLKNSVQVTINNSRVNPQIVRNYRAVCNNQIICTNTATLESEILTSTVNDPFYNIEKIQIEKTDALANEADHFIQAILGKKKLAITAGEATKALINIEKIIAQIEEA